MKKILTLCLILLSLLLTSCKLFSNLDKYNGEVSSLAIHVIDVGQADSIYIRLPNKENMLIDAGENSDGITVINYLKNKGVKTLDYVIGTHPDADHIGGLDDVIKAFDVKSIYLPDRMHTTKTFEDVLIAIEEKGLTFTLGESGHKLVSVSIDGKPLIVEIMSPDPQKIAGYDNNNSSIVIKITYGKRSFLFMGDAEVPVEKDLLEKGLNLKADVLKVGHHGSNTSTSEAFLKAVNPSIALISAGIANKYGHPHQIVLERLEKFGVEIYRTDQLGTIIVSSDGNKISVNDQSIEYDEEQEVTTDYPIVNEDENESLFIVINEIYPAPYKDEKEWVELYNPTDQSIDLNGYKIDDIIGGGRSPIILEGVIIPAQGYYIIEVDGMFNNDGDEVHLLSPEGICIDSFQYDIVEIGKSYYRLPDGGSWMINPGIPTYKAKNE